jgi:competence protein ComEC
VSPAGPVPEEPGRPGRWVWVDLRLVPVAASIWTVQLAAPYLAPLLLGGVAVASAGLAAFAFRRVRATLLLAVLAGLAVASGFAVVHGLARADSPLRVVAESGRTTTVVLHLDGQARALSGGPAMRVVADATVTTLVDGAARHGLNAAVLLFAPADGWLELAPGQPVRARVRTALPRPGDDVIAVLSARGPPTRVGDPPALQRGAELVRSRLAGSAQRMLGERPAGLLPGLVVGDTSGMDPVLVEQFRRAGLSHLTAVSGANVAIVIAGVLWPLRRRAVDRRTQAALAGLALLGFVVLAGPSASVLRAAAMGAVALIALASGRPRAAVPALAATVCVLLLVDPGLARDAGFALSVVATAAIVLLAPGWSRRLRSRGWPPWIADALAVSAAAGVATAPLIAGLSGTVSLVSLPANLLAAPAVAPATVLGLAAAVVGVACPPVADALVWLAGWAVRWLVLVGDRAAAIPDAAAGWPAGSGGALLLTGLLMTVGWLLWRYRKLRPLAVAAVVGLVVLGWPVRQVVRGWPPTHSVVVACDVGQGDALVLPTGEGEGVLVDSGPDVGAVDRCLDRLGIDSVPLVLLSHLDADHAGGLRGALDGRDVGTVATGTLSPADNRAPALDALVRRSGARRAVLVPGDRRTVGKATIEVLAPEPRRATAFAEPNDLSMVVRVTYRGIRVLFTGDLGAEAEARIVAAGTDLRADVLKVPHHGSADADPDFLTATGARVALVSVGADNTYGHPAPSTLRVLERAGMRVHRTDREGDLAVAGDAGSWGVATTRSPDGMASSGNLIGTGGVKTHTVAAVLPATGKRRTRVTRCGGASDARGADVPPSRDHRRGGAPPVARADRGPLRRARPPPGRGTSRAGRGGAAGGSAGRRPGAVALRWPPARRGHRGAGVGRRARRLAGRLRQGSRSRPHARTGPLRRQAQRRTGQGVHLSGGRRRRVRQGLVRR